MATKNKWAICVIALIIISSVFICVITYPKYESEVETENIKSKLSHRTTDKLTKIVIGKKYIYKKFGNIDIDPFEKTNPFEKTVTIKPNIFVPKEIKNGYVLYRIYIEGWEDEIFTDSESIKNLQRIWKELK